MAPFNPGWDDRMVTPSSRRIYCTDCGAICPSTAAAEIEAWLEEHARGWGGLVFGATGACERLAGPHLAHAFAH